MLNNLCSLLERWYPKRDSSQWVLGTVYDTFGPTYRKAGSMMLLSDDGQQLGMLSGGCLESDIHRHARKALLKGESLLLTYDGSDEDDVSFQLGIGCGGRVHIVLQPVTQANHYLRLADLHRTLSEGRSGVYEQIISPNGKVAARFTSDEINHFSYSSIRERQQLAHTFENEGETWLSTRVFPSPHLLIIGGGADAQPMVAQSNALGWRTSVWDPRPANARAEYFPDAYQRLRCEPEALAAFIQQHHVNAAIVMSHSVSMDAKALKAIYPEKLQYVALLGPENRRAQVIEQTGIAPDQLLDQIHGPAGLDLGAQLPETIALSILAECHAKLFGGSGQPMKNRTHCS